MSVRSRKNAMHPHRVNPRTRQTTAEGVIAESYLNFSQNSVLQVIARLIGTKDVKSPSLKTAEP
jgi:hypothetical protein